MSNISLTASMRSNLLSLQGTANLMNQTQERLASGKKVNSAIDNPSSYYTAQSLNNRAGDLSGLLDSMGQAISTIKAADEGIEAITNFVNQAKAVATSALDTTDLESREKYAEQFNKILTEIDNLAKDSGYKGINLLKGDKLTVTFNEGRDNQLEIIGVDATTDAGGLNIAKAADWGTSDDLKTKATELQSAKDAYADLAEDAVSVDGALEGIASDVEGHATTHIKMAAAAKSVIAFGGKYYQVGAEAITAGAETALSSLTELKQAGDKLYYASGDAAVTTAYELIGTRQTAYDQAKAAVVVSGASNINTAIDAANNAINTLRTYSSDFGNSYAIVQTREEFTTNLINVLEEGADKLTLADMNEESANMLALQTRQQLAINSLSLASQAAQSVLKLF